MEALTISSHDVSLNDAVKGVCIDDKQNSTRDLFDALSLSKDLLEERTARPAIIIRHQGR